MEIESIDFWEKVQATGHLVSSSLFLFVFILGVSSVPVMHTLHWLGIGKGVFTWFMVGFFSMIIVYYVGNIKADISGRDKGKAFLEGFWGFIRSFYRFH